MKVENQNVEFKESWRDEYIKWICGFANAHGGSGSTKQLLQGAALTSFLLQKTGKKWDSVPIDGVSVSDLDKESFDIFRREALRSGRMSNDDLKLSDEQLLDNLNLLDDGKLKRAAILLFHRRPEKWITGAFVKIGYFDNDADLRYQDEIQGSLMIQADRVIELIYTKYLKAEISYDNITRIEHYPFPKDAIREAVFNALIHQDFAASIPVQISVYEDKLYISNDCVFPQNRTENCTQSRRTGGRKMKGDFYHQISDILATARNKVYQTANFTIIQTFWNMSKFIIKEQGGYEKATHCVANWTMLLQL